MSSPSASGRSNGSRLVSANAATTKMKKASESGNTFHVKSDEVGRGLQQSLRAHAVRTEPILHPGTDAPLGEREQGHAHHDRGEDHDDLDDRTDDEERHAGTPAPTLTRRPTSPTLE